MEIKVNGEQISLKEKSLNVIAAKNGWGKTSSAKAISFAISNKRDFKDKKGDIEIEIETSKFNGKSIYFSFDELEIKADGVFNVNFLETLWSDLRIQIDEIVERNGISKNETNSLYEVLQFRWALQAPFAFKTIHYLKWILNYASEQIATYSDEIIFDFVNYYKDKIEFKKPSLSTQYDSSNMFWDFNYLTSEYFVNWVPLVEAYRENNFEILSEAEMKEKYKFFESLEKIQFYGPKCGFLICLIFAKRNFEVLQKLSKTVAGQVVYMNVSKSLTELDTYAIDIVKAANENLEGFGIKHFKIEKLANQTSFRTTLDIKSISKSEKYRVLVAMLLPMLNKLNPQINFCLFLDDPFDSLDAHVFSFLVPRLIEKKQNMTTIILTHKMDVFYKIEQYQKEESKFLMIGEKEIFHLEEANSLSTSSLIKFALANKDNSRGSWLLIRRFAEMAQDKNLYEFANKELYSKNTSSFDVSKLQLDIWNSYTKPSTDGLIKKEVLRKMNLIADFKVVFDDAKEIICKCTGLERKSVDWMFLNGKMNALNSSLMSQSNLNVLLSMVEPLVRIFFENRSLINDLSHFNGTSVRDIILLDDKVVEKFIALFLKFIDEAISLKFCTSTDATN